MPKTLVVTQSNYIPWRGYFDLLRNADEVLFLDNVQYTRQDWRNRNIIKTPTGTQWLTIPIVSHFPQMIDETRIANPGWKAKHLRSIETNYRRAAAFDETANWLFDLFKDLGSETLLSACNQHLIQGICARLGISTPIGQAQSVMTRAKMKACDPTERLIELCIRSNSTRYLSGPAAKSYLDTKQFEAVGIEVEWMNYERYRLYPQVWGDFEPRVSIVDLLLNCGANSPNFLEKD